MGSGLWTIWLSYFANTVVYPQSFMANGRHSHMKIKHSVYLCFITIAISLTTILLLACSIDETLAATQADGWVHPSGGIPEQLLLYCATIKYLALEAGLDPDARQLEKIVYLAIDDDKVKAWHRLSVLQRFYGRGYRVNGWCAYGPPADCAAFIRRTLESGIKRVLVCLMSPDVAELERLRREVIPLLE